MSRLPEWVLKALAENATLEHAPCDLCGKPAARVAFWDQRDDYAPIRRVWIHATVAERDACRAAFIEAARQHLVIDPEMVA